MPTTVNYQFLNSYQSIEMFYKFFIIHTALVAYVLPNGAMALMNRVGIVAIALNTMAKIQKFFSSTMEILKQLNRKIFEPHQKNSTSNVSRRLLFWKVKKRPQLFLINYQIH